MGDASPLEMYIVDLDTLQKVVKGMDRFKGKECFSMLSPVSLREKINICIGYANTVLVENWREQKKPVKSRKRERAHVTADKPRREVSVKAISTAKDPSHINPTEGTSTCSAELIKITDPTQAQYALNQYAINHSASTFKVTIAILL